MEAQKKEIVEAIKKYVVPENVILVREDERKSLYHYCSVCECYSPYRFLNHLCNRTSCQKYICMVCCGGYYKSVGAYVKNGEYYCNEQCMKKYYGVL